MLKLKHLDRALRHEQLLERAAWKAANIGSTIACDVRNPYPQTLAMTLETPAAVAHANELLTNTKSGWRLLERHEPPNVRANLETTE